MMISQTQTMKAQLIKIGNSRGIRLPKAVLEQAGLEHDVTIEVRDGAVIVRAAAHPRAGWDEQFRKMADRGDDVLLDAPIAPTTWDDTEWQW